VLCAYTRKTHRQRPAALCSKHRLTSNPLLHTEHRIGGAAERRALSEAGRSKDGGARRRDPRGDWHRAAACAARRPGRIPPRLHMHSACGASATPRSKRSSLLNANATHWAVRRRWWSHASWRAGRHTGPSSCWRAMSSCPSTASSPRAGICQRSVAPRASGALTDATRVCCRRCGGY